jgi:hypothetical protein
MDMRRDLVQLDRVMTQVIGDPATAEEFIRAPNQVLARLGLHPRASDDVHDRVNRIFYAVLTNVELLEYVFERYAAFDAPRADHDSVLEEALGEGRIASDVEYDLAAAEHLFSDPAVLRRVFQLTLHDLNTRRLLEGDYTTAQLDQYIDEVVYAIQQKRPIREFPRLESWDDYYGIDKEYGGLYLEVGPTVTVGAAVEAFVLVTLAIEVNVYADVVKPEANRRAASGDPRAIRMLATAGTVIRFGGEVLLHANRFTRA